MKKIYLLLVVTFLFSHISYGQNEITNQNFLQVSELKIEHLSNQVLNASTDNEKQENNSALKALIEQVLKTEGAFSYPFLKIKSLGIFSSPDSVIRIFNWMIPLENGSKFQYETYVLMNQEEETSFIRLNPISTDSIELETFSGDQQNWPAALYYDLIQQRTYNRTYYTLLAWDKHNRLTSRKWIEVFWFNEMGELKIGAPIFKNKHSPNLMRPVFRYAAQNTIQLSYHKDLDQIEFDHLSPSTPSLIGIYEYYGADLTFDAYSWNKNFWEYKADIDIEKGEKKSKSDFKVDKDIIQEKKPIYQPK